MLSRYLETEITACCSLHRCALHICTPAKRLFQAAAEKLPLKCNGNLVAIALGNLNPWQPRVTSASQSAAQRSRGSGSASGHAHSGHMH